MKFTWFLTLVFLPLLAQQGSDSAYEEVVHTLSNGNDLIFQRLTEEQLEKLPLPTSINYFFDEELTLRVMGDWVYIDEAAMYETNIILVINPWDENRVKTLAGDILAIKPFDFIDLGSDGPHAMGTPPKHQIDYFKMSYDVETDEEMKADTTILQEVVDPWHCSSAHHDPSKPHPSNGNPDDPCHAEVGASGPGCQKGGLNGIAYLYCTDRVTPTSGANPECTAYLQCNNGSAGKLNGSQHASVNKVSCSSRRTGATSFFIQSHPDGTLEMQCDGESTTLDCRK